jgi:hypothetical protein
MPTPMLDPSLDGMWGNLERARHPVGNLQLAHQAADGGFTRFSKQLPRVFFDLMRRCHFRIPHTPFMEYCQA